MTGIYIPAFFIVGVGAILAALLILFRVIPIMAKTHKWHTSFLWLFVVGLGSLGNGIFFEILGYPSGRDLFLLADAALVMGALGLGGSWELQRLKKRVRGKDENN